MTTCRKPRNLHNIISRARYYGEYRTRRYYYTTRETYEAGYPELQLVRIERNAIDTSGAIWWDNWQLVAVLY
nr:MAG TPA: hypothetical protein [Caudoviricetes sp.]